MSTQISVQLTRSDTSVPWGFRISGGRDFGAPLTIQRVVPNGVAERAGLCPGDTLTDIAGSSTSSMCHRDAQQAIKNATNVLRLNLERSASASARHAAAADSLSGALRDLDVQGTPLNSQGYRSGVNSTAKPWRPSPAGDAGFASRGSAPSYSTEGGSASVSHVQPPPIAPVTSVTAVARSQTSGFAPVSASLSLGSAQVSATGPGPDVVPSLERRYSSGPVPFQAVARPSEGRKTSDADASYRVLPLAERKTSNGGSYRYQPSGETLAPASGHARWSEPNVTPYRPAGNRQGSAGSAQTPSWQRKVSDGGHGIPAGGSLPPPSVAPKPPIERRLSMERNVPPPPAGPPRWQQSPRETSPTSSSGDSGVRASPPVADNRQEVKPAPKKQEAGVCHHCKEIIRGPYLVALDRVYCNDHFRCGKCNDKLDKQPFIAHEGIVYCLKDYGTYVAPRCATCREPVVTDQMKAMDKVYHPQCFVCNMCKEPIAAGSFRLGTDNLPYCEKDWRANFQVVCCRCEYPIEPDERFIEALSKSYHADCFVCTTCQTRLEGKPFYNRNDHPYCREHINAR